MKIDPGHRNLLMVIALPVAIAAGIAVATGFSGLYGQDSFEYLRYMRSIKGDVLPAEPPGNFFWPVLYPLAGSLLSALLPDILSLQVISMAAFALTCFMLYSILVMIHPGRRNELVVYILLFVSLSPFLLRHAMTVMSDALAISMVTLFYYNYFVYRETRRPATFIWVVVSCTAATLTRYPAFILLALPLLHAGYLFIRNFSARALILSLLLAAALIIPEIFFHGRLAESVFDQPHFDRWSVANFFSASFTGPDGNLEYAFPNLLSVFKSLVHPGFIFTGIILLFLFRKREFTHGILLITLLSWMSYTIFLAGLPFQNDRVLLLGFPLVLIMFSSSFLRLSGRLKMLKSLTRISVIILIAVIQAGLFSRAFIPFYRDNRTTEAIVGEIRNYPARKIYTMNIDQALKAFRVDNTLVNLYYDRPSRYDSGALVLFNPDKFSRQWKGFNPMINWERLNAGHRLSVLETLPDGWILYEIEN